MQTRRALSSRVGAGLAGVLLGTVSSLAPTGSAHAVAAGLVGAAASLFAYNKCVDANRLFCEFLLLDPDGENVTGLSFTMLYDPGRIDIDPNLTPFFFADFSDGGVSPPIDIADGTEPLLTREFPLQGPRPGTTFSFTDNQAGTLQFLYDLSENPATGTGDRNFFGFGLNVLADFDAVQYFDAPGGSHDISFSNFSCTATVDDVPTPCGSSNPIFGIDFIETPEPSSIVLTAIGLVALGWLRRRRRSLASNAAEC